MDGLWKELVKWRYGEGRGNWCTQEVREAYGMGVRMGILQVKDLVMGHVRMEMGEGESPFLAS